MTKFAAAQPNMFNKFWLSLAVGLTTLCCSTLPSQGAGVTTHGVSFNQAAVASTPGRRVRIHLVSGRILTGDLDSRSSESRLWLRTGGTTAAVLRPIQWDRVIRVERGNETLTPAQFQEKMETILKLPLTDDQQTGSKQGGSAPDLGVGTQADRVQHALQSSIPWGQSPATPQVGSISATAYLAGWDADVEADGLILHVYPLAGDGECLKVHGTLRAHLTGFSQPEGSSRVLGDWSRMIRPEDFGPYGATVKLPFRANDPQFQLALQGKGLLHVTLSVPGHGKFEASVSPVRLRPADAVRDRLQQQTGRRYFDFERTGRSQ